jgi:hypothetical protein
MTETTSLKLVLPIELKKRVEAVALKQAIPTASAIRLSISEYLVKHETPAK